MSIVVTMESKAGKEVVKLHGTENHKLGRKTESELKCWISWITSQFDPEGTSVKATNTGDVPTLWVS